MGIAFIACCFLPKDCLEGNRVACLDHWSRLLVSPAALILRRTSTRNTRQHNFACLLLYSTQVPRSTAMPGSAYIPPSRRPMLHAYKYSGADQSLVSKYILGPYWNWLASLFPTSVAPNTITLSGLVLVFANFITLLAVDGALQCGTDARLAHAAAYSSGAGAVKEAVVSQSLRITPLLPRFGLPQGVIQDDSAWAISNFFRKTGGPGSHCMPSWIYYT